MAVTLASVAPTKHANPPRFVLHGGEKVGKSTFFSQAPGAIFVRTEDGLNGIDAAAFPVANTYLDVIEAFSALDSAEHNYKTLIVDSADWLEQLIWAQVCSDHNAKSIELAGGGYGKGYTFALDYWKQVISWLDYLNKNRNMAIGVICHSVVIPFNDPEHEPYDRYEMKLHSTKKQRGARDMLLEWADIIGFARKPIIVTKKEDTTQKPGKDGAPKVARAIATNQSNELCLVGSPAYVAGNRYSLPEKIPLNWADFQAAYIAATTQETK